MLASVYAPKDFKRLRAAGDIVARCFEFISPHIRAGISTGEIDRMVAAFLKENGTIGFVAPAFGCNIEPYKSAFQNAQKKLKQNI